MPLDRPMLDHQPALLEELFELSTFRAESEASIKDAYEHARQRIERDARQDLDARVESAARERRSIERARDEKLKSLTSRIDEEEASLHTRIEAERERLVEKADHNAAEAKKALQEAVWASETVFEAKENLPRERYDQTLKLIEQNERALEEVRSQTTTLLRRYRMSSFTRLLDVEPDRDTSDVDFSDHTGAAQEELHALRTMPLPRWLIGIRLHLLFVVPILISTVVTGIVFGWTVDARSAGIVGGTALITLAALVMVYRFGRSRVYEIIRSLQDAMRASLTAGGTAASLAKQRMEQEERQLREHRDREVAAAKERFLPVIETIEQRRAYHVDRLETEQRTEIERLLAERTAGTNAASADFGRQLEEHDRTIAAEIDARERERDTLLAEARQRYDDAWNAFETTCLTRQRALEASVERVRAARRRIAPSWDDAPAWHNRVAPSTPPAFIPIGTFHVDRRQLPGGISDDERLSTSLPTTFALPASLELPERCSLLIQSGADGRPRAVETLQNVALRVLTAMPPGKVRFTVIDPVGLGQSFAALMHLADYEAAQIIDKIWTETRHIEQRLEDLTEHMENVIQKYLRNEFDTIDAYNQAANEIAEPYRFLIISDFPNGFSDTAMRRLASIASSGARCGVYTLVYHDTRASLPSGFKIEDLERNSRCLRLRHDRFVWDEAYARDLPLELETPPSDEFVTGLLHRLGEASIEASRVAVPFATIQPPAEALWTYSSAGDLSVPLGRAGATKLQSMTLGRGTSQHVLIAGKTGSGKSTLLHALISNIALMYSPDDVRLYLIDFKKGVEFKPYATLELPHARAIAIESDREFGLSVLERIDEELRRRGSLFRDEGVQDLPGFRAAQPNVAMPRILLIIDEFQELFVDDDKLAQDASLLLDRLVRQGRAFGVHVILGSQTLGGAYSLARSTIGQMAVRIALQCSESDAYLIMSDDNAAARLLSRPGEAIYNDASGLVEGNSPFQVAWLPDEQRETILRRVRDMARADHDRRDPPAIVFEGNIPADIERNHRVRRAIAQGSTDDAPNRMHVWLGDAIAIKDPTSALLERHSGSNVLIVGQRDEAALAMMSVAMVSLAAQCRSGDDAARFVVLDGSAPDAFAARYWPNVISAIPHVAGTIDYRDVPDALTGIVTEIERRQEANVVDRPAIFLFIHGLQRYRVLRPTDDFSFSMDRDAPPAADRLFATILRDGPSYGVHTIAWCDTMNNLTRSLGRQELREFERRVLFQMSATDSASLIDSPAAARLGLQRALFYSEERGTLEKFRPYAVPPEAWLDEVRRAFGSPDTVDTVSSSD